MPQVGLGVMTEIGVQTSVAREPQKRCLHNVACPKVSGSYDSRPQRS
jgi:hypothetical protein